MNRDDLALALADICSAWTALLPPNRMPVSQGAANLIIKRPGGGSGPWSPAETPYMVEPIDMLASRRHQAVCFVGPAQSGKTVGMGEGWLAHAVVNDPGDMAIVQMTQQKAREYSKQRIDRALSVEDSPLAAALSMSAHDDNVLDKRFRNGMWLRLLWPTPTNLSSSSYRYVFGTDYDRWNDGRDDVGGEGEGFGMMLARIRTFLSRGKVAVESSPGRPIIDPTWRPSTPHEAPPVGTSESGPGILGIYNRGDRRRQYWKCRHCDERFQATPGLGLFGLDPDEQLIEDIRDLDIDAYARQHARIACPACGAILLPSDRDLMNRTGIWLADGLTIDALDRVSGNPRVSTIASYWLGGVAAAYSTWHMLIAKHLQGLYDYAMTGNELNLQTTINTDQGMPYMSRHLVEARDAAQRGSRFEHDLHRFIVPDDARFVVVAVDVQGGKNARFVVQAHAVGENNEQWLIDRYSITQSQRPGLGDEFAPIDPASHPEDWDVLTDKVLRATYRTNHPDRELRVKAAIVDTGGEGRKGADENVTNNSYAWARRVRKAGLLQRLRLSKGASTRADWHIRETKVGGAQGQGDVTLHLLEPNKFKDMVNAGLQRREAGPGYIHFPEPRSERNPDGWLPAAFFDELKAEVRNENGVWEQIKKRNEAFDLCYMIRALCMMLGTDKREFWTRPPVWALPLTEGNSEIVTADERRDMKSESTKPPPPAQERRVRRSAYLA